MKLRGTGLALLVLGLLGGLIAAIFTPAIAATLTVPAPGGTHPAQNNGHAQSTAVHGEPVPAMQSTMPANGVTVLAQDNFHRTNQTFWGTSSGLRAWGGDANTNTAFTIFNNMGQITGGQGALQAILSVTSADADAFVSGSVSQFDQDGAVNLGLVLRWQDANDWYKALIDGRTLQVLRAVNGHVTVLAEQPFQANSGTRYSLRFRVLGSTLFARAWPSAGQEPATWNIMKIDTQLTTGMSGIRVKVQPGVVILVTAFQETSVSGPM